MLQSARSSRQQEVFLFGLKKKLPPFRLEAVHHPVLGRLEPSEKMPNILSGSITAGGVPIDIRVNPDGASSESALSLAANAVSILPELDASCKLLATAECLASYNNDWRFGAVAQPDGSTTAFEKPMLREEQFVEALSLTGLYATSTGMLELSYEVGDLFWGHWLCVTSFDGLALTDTHVELQG